ncbi:hypothetical protein B296_00008019 [Ensete ventricosum]|uniref:Uncharacterized protein n=1 Tax=Ensete ventricosum TaxID=4639 RepID=A0A426XM27_ENSVE|nr:hypothetical protein B296_00008019 [Ensete ventricosum]
MTHPYILYSRDKLLLKCYIPSNSPWLPTFPPPKNYSRSTVAALTGHGRCLLPSLSTMTSPRPPATSYYASSPRPATMAKPSSNAPTSAAGQPLSFSSIAAKALNDTAVVLLYLLCLFFPLS